MAVGFRRSARFFTARVVLACAAALAVIAAGPGLLGQFAAWAASGRVLPAPPADGAKPAGQLEAAIVSGGCFWGVQGVFQHVKGVTQAVSGYDGGAQATAHYDLVSMGDTGHAETVKIIFDPRQISYGQILRVFFSVATDPTEVNHQGPDWGTQYRSEIWYTTPEQKRTAEAYIAELNAAHVFAHAIATRVDPDHGFYRAEAHHQDYLQRNPGDPYIVINDLPKVAALKQEFPQLYRETPVRTASASS